MFYIIVAYQNKLICNNNIYNMIKTTLTVESTYEILDANEFARLLQNNPNNEYTAYRIDNIKPVDVTTDIIYSIYDKFTEMFMAVYYYDNFTNKIEFYLNNSVHEIDIDDFVDTNDDEIGFYFGNDSFIIPNKKML